MVELGNLWHLSPQLRFTQLLSLLLGQDQHHAPDPFYTTDADLLARIRKLQQAWIDQDAKRG